MITPNEKCVLVPISNVCTSSTRSTIHYKSFRAIFEDFFSIWHNFETAFVYFFCYWAKFRCFKWPNSEKQFWHLVTLLATWHANSFAVLVYTTGRQNWFTKSLSFERGKLKDHVCAHLNMRVILIGRDSFGQHQTTHLLYTLSLSHLFSFFLSLSHTLIMSVSLMFSFFVSLMFSLSLSLSLVVLSFSCQSPISLFH